MNTEESKKRIPFNQFIDLYEQDGEMADAVCVGFISSITVHAHVRHTCTIVIVSPEEKRTKSLHIAVCNRKEFIIHEGNKDNYVGQYVVFSYKKRCSQLWIHCFITDGSVLLQDSIAKDHADSFETSIHDDQLEIVHYKKRARYKKPLIALFAMVTLWRKRRKKNISIKPAVISASQ